MEILGTDEMGGRIVKLTGNEYDALKRLAHAFGEAPTHLPPHAAFDEPIDSWIDAVLTFCVNLEAANNLARAAETAKAIISQGRKT